MKKIIFLLVSLIFLILKIDIVNAINYVDISQYDLNEEPTQINIDTSGVMVSFTNMIETRDGNVILLGSYTEENSNFKDNNYIIPGSDGGGVNGAPGGTPVRHHAKVVKLDSNYNKLWETNFYITGNWANASQIADTVQTTLAEVAELNDGSILAVGNTHGLVNDYKNYIPIVQEDAFNPIFVRFDSNGNEIYRRVFQYERLKEAIAVKALSDGGYVIKYTGYNVTVSSGNVSTEGSFYGIYNSNNELIELLPESENYKLDSYSFIEKHAILDIKNTTSPRIVDDYWDKRYIGVNVDGNLLYLEHHAIKSYDPYTSELKKTISIENLNPTNFDQPLVITNDGGIFVDNKLLSNSGELLIEYNKSPHDSGKTVVLSNGDIVLQANKYGTISVIKPTKSNEDFANFIIEGKKITSKLGTFLENDRTYININNLCGILKCKFRMSEKKPNTLIIDFPIVGNAEYTITHEIGSKKYTSYLSVQPTKIFRLMSPTFDESTVDVASKKIDGQIYVPLRFISEAIGRYVTYDPNGENGKPTITISGPNEGDFYEKYNVAISYDKYQNGDLLSNPLNDNKLELAWGLKKLVYGYGYETSSKKIVSTENTVFVPLCPGNDDSEYIEYNEKSDSSLENHYQYLRYESANNWIGKQVMYKDDNGKEGEKYYGDGTYTTFLVVSNIEGYPFVKVVYFN